MVVSENTGEKVRRSKAWYFFIVAGLFLVRTPLPAP